MTTENIAPTEVTPPSTKTWSTQIPASIPDVIAHMGMQLGLSAMQALHTGNAYVLFPTKGKDSNGQVRDAIGRCVVPLLCPQDVEYLVTLAEVIAAVNLKKMHASPTDALSVAVEGDKLKANAARDITAKAKGEQGGIILAS